LKGREAEPEIEAAGAIFDFTAGLHPSLTSPDSHVVEVTSLRSRGANAP
jgi:hypothetical protein